MTPVLISVGIFLAMVLLIEGGYYAFRRVAGRDMSQVKRRLRATSVQHKKREEPVNIIRTRSFSDMQWLNDFLMSLPRLNSIEMLLLKANSHMPLGVFLMLSGVCAGVGMLVAVFRDSGLLVMVLFLLAGGMAPFVVLMLKKNKRMKQFQVQLPDALDLVARSLRAGHAFSIGMKMVGEEMPDPIGPEFTRTVEEISFGIDIPEALANLSARVECEDLLFFVTSLNVQRETGGNLAEIIESIASLIRGRFELQGRIKALSAEGRLSAVILFALPFVIAGALKVMNPEYLDVLFTDPIGPTILGVALGMLLLGAVVTKKMITIKV